MHSRLIHRVRSFARLNRWLLSGALCVCLLLCGALPVVAQTSYTGSTANGPRFRRPNGGNPPISLASTSGTNGSNVAYHTYVFTPTQTAQYRIVSTTQSPTWDNFIALYQGTFNATTPLVNCLAANDDYGSTTRAGIDAIPLTANQSYTIVVTAFANAGQGAFETVILKLPTTTATTGHPVFQRPNPYGSSPPTSLSGAASAVPYNTQTYTPAETGVYRFVRISSTPGFDPFTVLYQDSFNPAQPLTNALLANDDLSGETISGIEAALTANRTYIVVTTGSTLDDYGAYSASVERVFSASAGGSTQGAATFQRPDEGAPPTQVSPQATAVPYVVFRLTVAGDSDVNVTVTSQTVGYDPFTVLYQTAFDASRPLENVLRANDDKGITSASGFEAVPLTPGTDYFLIVTGYSNGDFGDFSLTISGEAPITLTTHRGVTGTVKRKDCPEAPFTATMIFRPPDSSGDITREVSVAADGTFAVSDLRAANYQVKIKTSNTLANVVSADTTRGDATIAGGELLGGDANGDNFCDVLDLALFIRAFDAAEGDPNWLPGADFTCDGLVDVSDLDVFIRNFDREGEDFH